MGTQGSGKNGVQLDDALKHRVEECAHANGVSTAQLVQGALEAYLATHASNGGHAAPGPNRPLFEVADSIAATVPADAWAQLPVDLAKNFEHYRYGYPRED